nr:hypothetical protein GCM10020093_059550 [Planobispora longispora]
MIEAGLEPMVVVAGAGSGKSETMAGRVVWLVANGLVRPEQVLGLTFTRKAASELSHRVRERLAAIGRDVPADMLAGEPTISTYHAYASRLVTEHALREALEPTMRLITPAVAWQLAGHVVSAYDGPMEQIEWGPATVTRAVLELAGELAEHMRDPADVREVGAWLTARYEALPGSPIVAQRRPLAVQRARSSCSRWWRRTTGSSAGARSSTTATRWRWPPGSRPNIPRSAGSSGTGSPSCSWTSTRTPATPSSSCSARCSAAATR